MTTSRAIYPKFFGVPVSDDNYPYTLPAFMEAADPAKMRGKHAGYCQPETMREELVAWLGGMVWIVGLGRFFELFAPMGLHEDFVEEAQECARDIQDNLRRFF